MEKSERQNRKNKIRTVELIVWLCILIFLGVVGSFLLIRHDNSYEMHNIYMPDIDGLIVGSPVYIMGIQVGYVTKTKIINDDEIKVRFKITNKSIKVPRGTVATVEFSGLGGSKSLQLYPPNGNAKITEELLMNNTEYILVERPKRLRDASALLYEMYKTLMNIIYTVTIFGNEVSKTEGMSPTAKMGDVEEFINYSDEWLDSSIKSMDKIRNTIHKFTGGKYDWRSNDAR